MLIRSSSTSATGTLRTPFSESPKRGCHHINCSQTNYIKLHGFFRDHKLFSSCSKLHLRLTSLTSSGFCSVSELNPETSISRKGLRRALSDSNLDRLVDTARKKEKFHSSAEPKKLSSRHQWKMLRTAPSFSVFNRDDLLEHEDASEGDVGREKKGEALMRTATIGDSIETRGCGEFCFRNNSMRQIEEESGEEEKEEALDGNENLGIEEHKEPASPPLYLAAGLGIDAIDFGVDGRGAHGVDFSLPNFDGGDDVENCYKMMIDDYPCHPLFLSNYARLLQAKGDLHGAEEYFHRATLADPEDGEILMQYAKLEWELHHDQNRALGNFERALQTAPHNSHVVAAYASFLWEIDDDKEDTSLAEYTQVGDGSLNKLDNPTINKEYTQSQLPAELRIAAGEHAISETDKDANVEDYYRRMIEENPCNSLVLRNYAEFLCRTKGDPHAAEEYYSRAVLADPGDGEIMVQYAKLLWELHHDRDKASCYFEQAVQAAPGDSYVLGAYASFMWETEESEDDDGMNQFQEHNLHKGAATAAASARELEAPIVHVNHD